MNDSNNRSAVVFGNSLNVGVQKRAEKAAARFRSKYGADDALNLKLEISPNSVLEGPLGVRNIAVSQGTGATADLGGRPLVIGTIRMGYGHFRISMAIASAARQRGCTPLWFDMHSFADTTAGKIIRHQNELYSLGSRLSQQYALFNKLYWEPLNSEGFRQLSYNAVDQKVAELMAPVCAKLPTDVPFVATHVWPAQAAVHAGISRVVNVVPDNWPMALHLAEGAIHTVQTPSAWLGYKSLDGMNGKELCKPMPDGSLEETGHYIDHELLQNLEGDCSARIERRKAGEPLRLLVGIGGAGAQKEFLFKMLDKLAEPLKSGKIILIVNAGDHVGVRDGVTEYLKNHGLNTTLHNDWEATKQWIAGKDFCTGGGHHVLWHQGIFEAVYSTNLLMPVCDVLMTKPSELAFYPVPKLLIKRIGGHEAWGAIRSADLGDGCSEIQEPERAAAMVSLMLEKPLILERMNKAILAANQSGIYNGAYRVVDLALQKEGNR